MNKILAVSIILMFSFIMIVNCKNEPEFHGVDSYNITLRNGEPLQLSVYVRYLGDYNITWFYYDNVNQYGNESNFENQTDYLFIDDEPHYNIEKIIDYYSWDSFSNLRPQIKTKLHINETTIFDSGVYICQINTVPIKQNKIYVQIVKEPTIYSHNENITKIVNLNDNVILRCPAYGNPEPTVKWIRDDDEAIIIDYGHSVHTWYGDKLKMNIISLASEGNYRCIASNGLPPNDYRTFQIIVNTSIGDPKMIVGKSLIDVKDVIKYNNNNITLECFVEIEAEINNVADHFRNYWLNTNYNKNKTNTEKYMTEQNFGITYINYEFRRGLMMKLTIFDVSSMDYGLYKCYFGNDKVDTSALIKVYNSSP